MQAKGHSFVALSFISTFCIFHSVVGAGGTEAVAPPMTELDRTSFEAQGTHDAILTVHRYGRYSLATKSGQGTSLQIYDRMMGPGEISGAPGNKDGRIDTYFDEGNYRIELRSHKKGQGEVALSVHSFKELNQPQAPVLIENKLEQGLLDDYQQISYWIEIKERRFVYIEAEGRNLSDLRLWQDGSWMLDAVPTVQARESAVGHPQTDCLLVADLTPGYYLLTAYGGRPNAWAKETDEHPFHLRLGIPELGSVSRLQLSLSPFGMDRFLVPQEANFFLLQLAKKKDFRLDIQYFNPGDVPGRAQAGAVINKKSQDPECAIETHSPNPYSLVTVSGAPGEAYILQVFRKDYERTFRKTGDYWISTIQSGYMDDDIDASGILVSSENTGSHVEPLTADVVHLSANKGWARRFNLLGVETLFFFVDEAGEYEIKSTGTTALYRFEPFMINVPQEYRTPESQPSGGVFDLDRGYWVLTISPENKGILAVVVQKRGGLIKTLLDKLMSTDLPPPEPVKGACQLGRVHLDDRFSYTLYTNTQGGSQGLILRPYPLKLEDPLPLVLKPAEEEKVDFIASEESELSAATITTGISFTSTLDGNPCGSSCLVSAGEHSIVVRNDSPRTQIFSLKMTSIRILSNSKPAYLTSGVLENFPKFPVMTEKTPLFGDYGYNEKKTFLLTVASPALYRIETSGLLKTACVVRTRTRTKLFSAEANGVGRNALIQQFLKDGEYQVTVEPLDRSAGHAGIQLMRTSVLEGGALTLGKDAKEDVPAGSAVRYSFHIPEAGRYKLTTFGIDKKFRCRIEDADGWPLRDPSGDADLTWDFQSGDFHYMTLPLDVDSLRVAHVQLVKQERTAEGKGPHQLFLNQALGNVWRESPDRARDLYDLNIPADIDATLTLGNDQMQAFIKRKDGTGFSVVDTAAPGQAWSGALGAGDYRIEAECSRPNDYLSYSIKLDSKQLVDGTHKQISVPGSVDVRVGKTGIVEMASTGPLDVRATLSSDAGIIDANDDSFNDWNFRIARKLEAGWYHLQIDPVGKSEGRTTVMLSMPEEVEKEAVTLPIDMTLDLQGKINVLPVAGNPGIMSIKAGGGSFVGCILERVDGDARKLIWQQNGKTCEVSIPLDQSGKYQLRLWSADHQSENVRLQASSESPAVQPADDFTRPTMLRPALMNGSYSTIRLIRNATAGTFKIRPSEGFSYSTGTDQPLVPATSDLVALPSGLMAVRWECKGAQELRVQASRYTLQKDERYETSVVRSQPQWVDVINDAKGSTLIDARVVQGLPACALISENENPFLSSSFARIGDICMTIAPPGVAHTKVVIWNADPDAPASSTFNAGVQCFAKSAETMLPYGRTNGSVDASKEVTWTLPSEPKQIDVALDRGMVAYVWDGLQVVDMAFAGESPYHHTFMTGATHLTFLARAPGLFEIDMLKREVPAPPLLLADESLYELTEASPGMILMTIPRKLSPSTVLWIAGDGIESCAWTDEIGIVHEGSRLEVGGHSGKVIVKHTGGFVKIWTGLGSREMQARWGKIDEGPLRQINPQSVVPLAGNVQWYGVILTSPSVIHCATSRPAVVGISRKIAGSLPQAIDAHFSAQPDGDAFLKVAEGLPAASLDFFLEPGNYIVGVRAPKGETLTGTAEYSHTPVIPISKLFGPETLIRGGESMTFSFTLAQHGNIGIGLKSEGEALSCELLSRDEKAIGKGIQQFVELDAGTYLMRVALSAGEEPQRFTPVVVGIEPPGMGPPEDYLHDFLQKIDQAEGGH